MEVKRKKEKMGREVRERDRGGRHVGIDKGNCREREKMGGDRC